uniref:RUN and SH3 domain containing 1 n=1 Tax=Lepisosteus oculatus TaxID=7918 RepID=W5MGX1_LEPOC
MGDSVCSSDRKQQGALDAQAFDAQFMDIVRDVTEHDITDPAVTDALHRLRQVMEYNAPGGKRNRGLSVIGSLRELAAPSELTPEAVQRALVVGWCIEMLQAFFLVADDIMDASLTRRGQACWYKKDGVGLDAINDAFLLEGVIYRLLRRHCRGEKYYTQLLELFLETSFQTELGQALDLMTAQPDLVNLARFTEERYRAIVKYKTAFYSFYLPVAAAMYMAGIDSEEEHSNAKAILLEMGEFFQIQVRRGRRGDLPKNNSHVLYTNMTQTQYEEDEEDDEDEDDTLVPSCGDCPPSLLDFSLSSSSSSISSCSDFESDSPNPLSPPDSSLGSLRSPGTLPPQPSPPPAAVRSASFSGSGQVGGAWMASSTWTPPGNRGLSLPCLQEKKALVSGVSVAVEAVLSQFSSSRTLVQKAQSGDSSINPSVGRLVLQCLCPALCRLLSDSLKPYQSDLIAGRRPNSPWGLVQASTRPGTVLPGPCTQALSSLQRHVDQLPQLRLNSQRFNAFLLGLLNLKLLDFWLSHLQSCEDVLVAHYSPASFMRLARTSCQPLFEELLLLLQPLALLTFHLDLLFEHHHLDPRTPPSRSPEPAGGADQEGLGISPAKGDISQNSSAHQGGGQGNQEHCTAASANQEHKRESPTNQTAGRSGTANQKSKEVPADQGSGDVHRSPSKELTGRPGGVGADTPRIWLGRLFGASKGHMDTSASDLKATHNPLRRPSSWLVPGVSVLTRMASPAQSAPPEGEQDRPRPRTPRYTALLDRSVRTLCDHQGTGAELSFKKGEELLLIGGVDEEWIRCRQGDREGLVP